MPTITNKPLSHFDRLNNHDNKHTKHCYDFLELALPVREEKVDDATKRVVVSIAYHVPDKKCNNVLKVSDFCLENLIRTGNIDTLNTAHLSHDTLTNIAVAEQQIINNIK